LGGISHNVLSMRRSSPPNRQTAGLWWAGMWVRENRTKRSDCGFSNPEGANGARSAYCLLSAVSVSYSNICLYKYIFNNALFDIILLSFSFIFLSYMQILNHPIFLFSHILKVTL